MKSMKNHVEAPLQAAFKGKTEFIKEIAPRPKSPAVLLEAGCGQLLKPHGAHSGL
jgi:hypothetical protein